MSAAQPKHDNQSNQTGVKIPFFRIIAAAVFLALAKFGTSVIPTSMNYYIIPSILTLVTLAILYNNASSNGSHQDPDDQERKPPTAQSKFRNKIEKRVGAQNVPIVVTAIVVIALCIVVVNFGSLLGLLSSFTGASGSVAQFVVASVIGVGFTIVASPLPAKGQVLCCGESHDPDGHHVAPANTRPKTQPGTPTDPHGLRIPGEQKQPSRPSQRTSRPADDRYDEYDEYDEYGYEGYPRQRDTRPADDRYDRQPPRYDSHADDETRVDHRPVSFERPARPQRARDTRPAAFGSPTEEPTQRTRVPRRQRPAAQEPAAEYEVPIMPWLDEEEPMPQSRQRPTAPRQDPYAGSDSSNSYADDDPDQEPSTMTGTPSSRAVRQRFSPIEPIQSEEGQPVNGHKYAHSEDDPRPHETTPPQQQ